MRRRHASAPGEIPVVVPRPIVTQWPNLRVRYHSLAGGGRALPPGPPRATGLARWTWGAGRRIVPCMASVVNINEVLDGHVSLEVDCVDRLYLNAYVPNLQVGGQVERFCKEHLGQPIASPAVIEKLGTRFQREVKAFAAANKIPILQLKKPDRSRWDDREFDHVRPYLEAAERTAHHGVVTIVAAQEFQWVFSATKKTGSTVGVWYDWAKSKQRVGDLLLLRVGSRLRARVHQDLHLLPVSGQGVDQRPRVGQAPSRPGRHQLPGAGRRVRCLRQLRPAAADL